MVNCNVKASEHKKLLKIRSLTDKGLLEIGNAVFYLFFFKGTVTNKP